MELTPLADTVESARCGDRCKLVDGRVRRHTGALSILDPA